MGISNHQNSLKKILEICGSKHRVAHYFVVLVICSCGASWQVYLLALCYKPGAYNCLSRKSMTIKMEKPDLHITSMLLPFAVMGQVGRYIYLPSVINLVLTVVLAGNL